MTTGTTCNAATATGHGVEIVAEFDGAGIMYVILCDGELVAETWGAEDAQRIALRAILDVQRGTDPLAPLAEDMSYA